MGQSISDLPPEHRPGEHYQKYDANAWRRLSQTYLNKMLSEDKLTPEELDLIELEQYWHYTRRTRKPRTFSLSPVSKRQRRLKGNHLRNVNSVGNIPNALHDSNIIGVSGGGRRPVWKNFEESSHLTRNNHYQYHSLADLSRVKPTRDQLENWNNNFNKNQRRNMNNDSRNQKRKIAYPNQSGFDSSLNSYSSNELPVGRFERNRPRTRNTLSRDNLDDNFPGDAIRMRNESYQTKSNFQGPKVFQEYSPKSIPNNDGSKQRQPMKNNKHLLSNGKSYNVDNNHRLKSCLRDSPLSSHDSSSSPNSFNRTDSTRTTGQKSHRTFSQDDENPKEKIVERFPSSYDSSFHRRQQQSQVPGFRINSQERLNLQTSSDDLDNIRQNHNYNHHHNSNNHVHFKENDYFIHAEDTDVQDDYDTTDDDYDDEYHFNKRRNNLFNGYQRKTTNSSSKSLSPSTYIPYKGYFFDMEHPHYSNYYQSFDRPQIGYTKCIYVVLLFINICCAIWNSVYMHFASIKIELGQPINGRLYSMSLLTRHIWQGSVISVIVFNCLLSMFAIYATLRQKYWIIWICTVLLFLIAAFGAFTEFQRDSVSAWLLPLICGHCGIILTHQIAIKHYSI